MNSVKPFTDHIDPAREEQLQWLKIEVENQAKRILKLVKTINYGNKEANQKKKSELIHLVQDFEHRYDSLYSLYENLKDGVKKTMTPENNINHTHSSSDSELFHTPKESNANKSSSEGSGSDNVDLEHTILKDKLTSSSEVKRDLSEIVVVKDLTVQDQESEAQIVHLNNEIEALGSDKRRLENEAAKMSEKISSLEARVLELEDKESEVRSQNLEEREAADARKNESEVELMKKSNEIENLKAELEQYKSLMEKKIIEEKDRLEVKLKDFESEIASLNQKNLDLEEEIAKARESEVLKEELKRKTELEQYQNLMEKKIMEEKDRLEVKLKDFEAEIASLNQKNVDLGEEIAKARESEVLKEELKRKISQLEKSLSDRENEVSSLHKKFESLVQSSDAKIRNLEKTLHLERDEKRSLQEQLQVMENDKAKLEQEKHEFSQTKSRMEQKNAELTDKIADQQKTLIDLGNEMSELKRENEQAQIISSVSKSDFKFVEKKIEETTEEFRKQFEDKYRILSRRIRVAEQLHAENKEWYRASKESYEQEMKDLQTGFKNIKDLSVLTNETLVSLDSMLMKFEECNVNFLNRVSKASCELKFAKDWATRKNEALSQVKGDLECLIAQLDHKESEILGFRERIWRSDNKVRDLEKMLKERDEYMLGLKEEKREAIRQLCVWIDYHRSRSDYYLKVLSDNNVLGRKKTN